MDIQNDEFLKLTACFAKHHVRYLIVGGFAVNRYGFKRTTGDLDIYLQDTLLNRQNLVEALAEMNYGRFEELLRVPILPGYCEILMDNGMYADLMTQIKGLDPTEFDTHFELATVDEINGSQVRFLHYNNLIDNKIATGRSKDKIDVEELEKLRNQL